MTDPHNQYTDHPAPTHKFAEGGEGGEGGGETLRCDRCNDPACRSYEGGRGWLTLCDRCYHDLGRWLR